jgi:hypothetical protein
MTTTLIQAVLDALALPDQARVDQRVPKKLLLEQGAPTAADRRALQDSIEEVQWVATLKPDTIAVPAFRDDVREYLEVPILVAVLRPNAKSARLQELIHRAIPYPLVLLTAQDGSTIISLAHKRQSLGETTKTVLDGDLLAQKLDEPLDPSFAAALRTSSLPATNLYALYEGLVVRLQALAASRLTGAYSLPQSPTAAATRATALADRERILREMSGLRANVAKETQINRRVDLNLAIKRLEAELGAATKKL